MVMPMVLLYNHLRIWMENPMMPWFFSLQSSNSAAVRVANQPSAESHCDVVDDFLYLCSGANVAFAKNAELRASAATAVARGVCPSNAYTTWPCGPKLFMFINNVKQHELCSSCKTIFTSRKINLINKHVSKHIKNIQKRPLRSLRFGCRGKSLLHQRSSQCVRCTKPARLEVEHSQVAGNQQEILIVKAATLRKMMQNYVNSKHMKQICQHM